MSKVYITEVNAFDYSPAQAHGELVVLKSQAFTAGDIDNDWNNAVIAELRRQLADYVPGRDYILPTGKPVKICVISMLLAEKGRTHKFLAWDAMHYRYIEHTICLGPQNRGMSVAY